MLPISQSPSPRIWVTSRLLSRIEGTALILAGIFAPIDIRAQVAGSWQLFVFLALFCLSAVLLALSMPLQRGKKASPTSRKPLRIQEQRYYISIAALLLVGSIYEFIYRITGFGLAGISLPVVLLVIGGVTLDRALQKTRTTGLRSGLVDMVLGTLVFLAGGGMFFQVFTQRALLGYLSSSFLVISALILFLRHEERIFVEDE